MTAPVFSLVELSSPQDDLLLPWLDLYETAFPPAEKVLVSNHLSVLRAKAAGRAAEHHLLAVLDGQNQFAGLARYELRPQAAAAYLWYFAVLPGLRGTGLGSAVYRHLIQRIGSSAIQALVLEVEIPEQQSSPAAQEQASRRIAFYRRLGARLLGGIAYTQSVGSHQPPTPMHLMIHPLRPLTPFQAFALAQTLFEGAVRQVEALSLD